MARLGGMNAIVFAHFEEWGEQKVKLEQILNGINVTERTAAPRLDISDICYDSRLAKPGDLFVAIEGFRSDGHDYIDSAVKGGAVAVLCSKKPVGDIPFVLTADTRLALAIASKNLFGDPASKLKLIGVTGTNGKTTSALLMKHMIEVCTGERVGLIGTNGVFIGDSILPSERTTPESYDLHRLFSKMVDAGCTYAVMEVSSHSLVLKRVAGLNFKVGLFTNLTQDHLDFHGNMEEYAKAKAMLFAACEKAVINFDDDYGAYMYQNSPCPAVTFSAASNEADFIAKDIKLLPDCVKFCVVTLGEIARTTLHIPGRFSVYNALGVISCGAMLGLELQACADAMTSARGVKGRLETVPTDGDYTIIIDYAHTPDALQNVLSAVRETALGRVVALFGCGGDRDKTKRPVMGKIGTEMSDFAVITSDNPRTEDPEAIIADILAGVEVKQARYIAVTDRVKAIEWAIENHEKDDIIVLAGKGHETYQEVCGEKRHMDEREIVAEIMEKRKNG